MSKKDEYLINGSLLKCSFGITPSPLTVTSNFVQKIQGKLVATAADKIGMLNIASFGTCPVPGPVPVPCTPLPLNWTNFILNKKILGNHILTGNSCIMCSKGGMITPVVSTQVPGVPMPIVAKLNSFLEKASTNLAELDKHTANFVNDLMENVTPEQMTKGIERTKRHLNIVGKFAPLNLTIGGGSKVAGYVLNDFQAKTGGDPKSVGAYFGVAVNQVVKGEMNESGETNALGNIGELVVGIGAGFLGVDLPLDVRDYMGHINKKEYGWAIFTAICAIPVIGLIKKPVRMLFKKVPMNNISDGIKKGTKSIDNVIENASEGIVKNIQTSLQDASNEVKKSMDDLSSLGGATPIKKLKNPGRAGKQPKLKSLLNDTKLSSKDRGWIKQEVNAIARGKRRNTRALGKVRRVIRLPPGMTLAHERGRESAKGYSYFYSNLVWVDDHKIQHKVDKKGTLQKERPVIGNRK